MTTVQPDPPDDPPDPAGSRAVLIGIDRYDGADFADLPAVARNVSELKTLLTARSIWGLPEEHVVCVDPMANDTTILQAVQTAARAASAALLVYFAGHGFVSSNARRLRLAVAESAKDQDFLFVRYEELRSVILRSTAALRIAVLDCCFSGIALGTMAAKDSPEYFERETVIDGCCVMTACAATELAHAPEEAEFTAYTGALIDVLRDGIPGGPPLLSPDAITRRAAQNLVGENRPRPHISGVDFGASAKIFYNVAYKPPVPVVSAPAPAFAPANTDIRPLRRRVESGDVISINTSANKQWLVYRLAMAAPNSLDADAALVCQRASAGYWKVIAEVRQGSNGLSSLDDESAYELSGDPSTYPGRRGASTWIEHVPLPGVGDAQAVGAADPARTAHLVRRGLSQAVVAAMVVDGRIWGELIVARKALTRPFNDDDLHRAGELASAFVARMSHFCTADQLESERIARLEEQKDLERMKLLMNLKGLQ